MENVWCCHGNARLQPVLSICLFPDQPVFQKKPLAVGYESQKGNPMNVSLQKNFIYMKMAAKAMKKSPSIRTLSYLVKYFSTWRKFLVNDRNSVADKQPWLSFPAIDFIKSIVKPNMRVFEYG